MASRRRVFCCGHAADCRVFSVRSADRLEDRIHLFSFWFRSLQWFAAAPHPASATRKGRAVVRVSFGVGCDCGDERLARV